MQIAIDWQRPIQLTSNKQLLFAENDPSEELFVVISGRIGIANRSIDGRESMVALMEPGDLFGDLPLLTAGDVQHIVRRDAPVVISPDRHGTGTNALLLRNGAAQDFGFMFGPGSYERHVEEAHRLGLEVATSVTPGTAIDLDTPEDLRLLGLEPLSPSQFDVERVRIRLLESLPR